MQMKCKCNANEMKCDQMQNKCIILGMIQCVYVCYVHSCIHTLALSSPGYAYVLQEAIATRDTPVHIVYVSRVPTTFRLGEPTMKQQERFIL